MVCPGLGLDVFAGFVACLLAFGKREAALLGGEGGEILHDVEELIFVLAAEGPSLGDGHGEELLDGPAMSFGSFVGGGSDADG